MSWEYSYDDWLRDRYYEDPFFAAFGFKRYAKPPRITPERLVIVAKYGRCYVCGASLAGKKAIYYPRLPGMECLEHEPKRRPR